MLMLVKRWKAESLVKAAKWLFADAPRTKHRLCKCGDSVVVAAGCAILSSGAMVEMHLRKEIC